MALLTREAILKVHDIATSTVAVLEWGGEVLVRGLSGAERDAFENAMIQGRGKNRRMNLANLRARLVAIAVVDEQGNRLFTDADIAALGEKSAAALERVFDVARNLSGLSEKDVDELSKNSPADQSDVSTSA